MGFDLDTLRDAVARHGPVARVVIAAVRGSSPREVGTAMLVWEDGQSGTIGGGALEFAAASAARAGHRGLSRHALGPDLGQCCGGAVTLFTEHWDMGALNRLSGGVIARPVAHDAAADTPLAVRRLLARARGEGVPPVPQLTDGWMVEPLTKRQRPVWVWGAGHVGRALVGVLAPLPDVAITWIDTGPERFPETVPEGVTVLPATNPPDLVRHAPPQAEHLVLTYSHALDLEICNRLLGHNFRFCGLIGSATKWARFRARLAALGHGPDRIGRICCPIGEPGLGKHPQAIALGVATGMLRQAAQPQRKGKDRRA